MQRATVHRINVRTIDGRSFKCQSKGGARPIEQDRAALEYHDGLHVGRSRVEK